jgi:hypothetical protein
MKTDWTGLHEAGLRMRAREQELARKPFVARKWWPQLFRDSVRMPWDEASDRHDRRILEALCGPWGKADGRTE